MTRRRMPLLLPLIFAVFLSGLAWGQIQSADVARSDVGIIGDDETDAFVGSGSLLLPPQVFHDGRVDAAECAGCAWRAVVQCEMNTAGSCRGPARLCGPDGSWLRVYLTRPGGAEQDLGAACYGPSGPVSRDSAEAQLRDEVIRAVPPLRPSRLPAGDVLAQLPVLFDTGQEAGPRRVSLWITDLPVDLEMTPRWIWDYADGARDTTVESAARHTYRHTALLRVGVEAVWRGRYWVAGLGPLEVAEPVLQSASVAVPVGEGRAVLIR